MIVNYLFYKNRKLYIFYQKTNKKPVNCIPY